MSHMFKKRRRSSTKKLQDRIFVDKIIGHTTTSRQAVDTNVTTGDVAYTAGSAVVIYSLRQNAQTDFLLNKSTNAVGCLAFSPCGKFLAVGEVKCEVSGWVVPCR
eukprot:790841_1